MLFLLSFLGLILHGKKPGITWSLREYSTALCLTLVQKNHFFLGCNIMNQMKLFFNFHYTDSVYSLRCVINLFMFTNQCLKWSSFCVVLTKYSNLLVTTKFPRVLFDNSVTIQWLWRKNQIEYQNCHSSCLKQISQMMTGASYLGRMTDAPSY